jgi:starch synthase
LLLRDAVPVFAFIGRLVAQKGVDAITSALDRVLAWDLQMVLLGTGDPEFEHAFARASHARGDRFRAWITFDDPLAHRIEAGADFFLMPSRYEPCGLNQMYSLRYGTLPIVRATGGLADSVVNYDEATAGGTGFVLHDLDAETLTSTVGWALSTWYDRRPHVELLRRRAMAQDFSWERAARAYVDLYGAAQGRRRAKLRG